MRQRLFFWLVSLAAIAAFWYLFLTGESSEPLAAAIVLGRCLQSFAARCYEPKKIILLIAADITMVMAGYLGLSVFQGTAPGTVIVSLGSLVVGLCETRAFETRWKWLWISSVVVAHLIARLVEQKILQGADSTADPIFWRTMRYWILAVVAGTVRASVATWLVLIREKPGAIASRT
jgi:hypothetical protein